MLSFDSFLLVLLLNLLLPRCLAVISVALVAGREVAVLTVVVVAAGEVGTGAADGVGVAVENCFSSALHFLLSV